jgi:phage protein U
MIAIDVKFAKLLDLTRGTVRKMMGISAARMSADDWRATNRRGRESLTQAVGRAAYECNLEGIVAPACDGGRNLVWFPGNLLKSSLAKIRNANMFG